MLPNMSFHTESLDFNREGGLVDTAQLAAIDALVAAPVTDLIVMSHGWNNDMSEADGLYFRLQASMQSLIVTGTHPLNGRILAVVGVHWPSKRFAEEDLIPGGAAGIGSPDVSMGSQIDALVSLFDGTDEQHSPADPDTVDVLKRAKALLPVLDQNLQAQEEFGRLIRSLMPTTVNSEEEVLDDTFFKLGGSELLTRLSQPMLDPTLAGGVAAGGGAALNPGNNFISPGGGAGLGNLFSGIKNGAQNLLNLFTYYEMKDRAGTVGAALANQLVKFQANHPTLRVHLIGHSFGGRLVSAALAATAGGGISVSSITLLQAAFSHWGFAQNYDGQKDGLFRTTLTSGRLKGAMLVTHSVQDRAVGLAYPIASRLRQQVASGIGDANDPYGGIGRNGALLTPEVDPSNNLLLGTTQPYAPFVSGRVYNLNGDANILSHGNVDTPFTAHVILAAMLGAQLQ